MCSFLSSSRFSIIDNTIFLILVFILTTFIGIGIANSDYDDENEYSSEACTKYVSFFITVLEVPSIWFITSSEFKRVTGLLSSTLTNYLVLFLVTVRRL